MASSNEPKFLILMYWVYQYFLHDVCFCFAFKTFFSLLASHNKYSKISSKICDFAFFSWSLCSIWSSLLPLTECAAFPSLTSKHILSFNSCVHLFSAFLLSPISLFFFCFFNIRHFHCPLCNFLCGMLYWKVFRLVSFPRYVLNTITSKYHVSFILCYYVAFSLLLEAKCFLIQIFIFSLSY